MDLSEKKAELAQIAKQTLNGARSIAIDGKTVLYGPDAQGNYSGLYWRDYFYTIQGLADLIPLEEIELAINYMLSPMLSNEAYPVFPKARTAQGFYTYNWRYPGPSHIFAADNPMFAIKVLHEYIQRGGDIEIFKQYADLLDCFLSRVEISDYGLVEDKVGPYVYGFYDTIELTGEILFGSLLWIEAAEKLSVLYKKADQEEKAAQWDDISNRGCQSLDRLWNDEEGMFISDTLSNCMIDVWGSAYAVFVKSVNNSRAQQISRWFVENYDRCIHRGHVRHTPKPDYWKKTGPDAPQPGQYQNGGYWSVPSPWVIHTIFLTDKKLAMKMQESLVEALVQLNCPECINEDETLKLPGYVASCAMGNLAMKFFE